MTLLEQHEVAYGASGRNPGFVWLHCRNPGFALEVSLAARRLYPELVADLPLPFEFRESGGLIYFLTPEQGDVVEEFVAARRRDGLADGDDRRRRGPPAGAADPRRRARCELLPGRRAHQHAAVVRSLAEGARRHGADVREGVTVTALARDGDRVVGVETDAGPVEGRRSSSRPAPGRSGCSAPTGSTSPIGGRAARRDRHRPLDVRIHPVVYGPLAAKQYTLFRDLPSWDEPTSSRRTR